MSLKKSITVKLLSYKSKAFQNAEGEAIIKVNGNEIECFLDTSETEKFLALKPKGKIKVRLFAMPFSIELAKQAVNSITKLSHPPTVNKYKLVGQVIEKKGDRMLIECGFIIGINGFCNAKVGNYVESIVRIDLYLDHQNWGIYRKYCGDKIKSSLGGLLKASKLWEVNLTTNELGWKHIVFNNYNNDIKSALKLANNDLAVKKVIEDVLKTGTICDNSNGKYMVEKRVTINGIEKNIRVIMSSDTARKTEGRVISAFPE
ncbi:MAG: hypothetical protein WC462_02015 [archaeon]